MLTREELAAEVEAGTIDTVVCAFTDMQGRLLGKREEAHFFLGETVEHGLEGCNYLLAVDMEMDPQPGYAMASWDRGYGDFHLRPDLGTLRRVYSSWPQQATRTVTSPSALPPGRCAAASGCGVTGVLPLVREMKSLDMGCPLCPRTPEPAQARRSQRIPLQSSQRSRGIDGASSR